MAVRLLLDPGGTRLKFGLAEGGHITAAGSIPWSAMADSRKLDWSGAEFPDWMMAEAVHPEAWVIDRPPPPAAGEGWKARFTASSAGRLTQISTLDVVGNAGFKIGYTKGHPGADRIAAAIACHRQDPDASFIIIDAGTCITVDLLSPGLWRGGAILPGLGLQASSMERAGLPVITSDAAGIWEVDTGPEGALGTSTDGALRAGIPWATRQAVEAVVRALMELDSRAGVVVTGGDAEHFDGLGGWRTFADPNLVLRGGALLLNE